jgi:hypothetical protein
MRAELESEFAPDLGVDQSCGRSKMEQGRKENEVAEEAGRLCDHQS